MDEREFRSKATESTQDRAGHTAFDLRVIFCVKIVIKFTLVPCVTFATLVTYLHERPLNGKGKPGAAGFFLARGLWGVRGSPNR